MDWTLAKQAKTFPIGSAVRFCRYHTRSGRSVWAKAIVYRRTKNFTFMQTAKRKVKWDNEEGGIFAEQMFE